MDSETIASTFGALVLGEIVSAGLSGIVIVQGIVFFKLYPEDNLRLKVFVAIVWFLDLAHTALVSAAVWHSLIKTFGRSALVDVIPKSIAVSRILEDQTHKLTRRSAKRYIHASLPDEYSNGIGVPSHRGLSRPRHGAHRGQGSPPELA
ncbi:hypothetical protein CPC08DRAFT_787686 [Agrocybe pediades]|nr:hypothetical protein CPC08DRAFT_787686 [Agrocybe pediades]